MATLPVGDFFVANDSTGKQYKIRAVAPFDEGDSPNLIQPSPPPWLETSDGHRVEYISKGRYRISNMNIDLISDDPKAYYPI